MPEALYDFFFFGVDHKAGILPTLYVDFDFLPSVGLIGFWNDAGFQGNTLTARFGIWTSDGWPARWGRAFSSTPPCASPSSWPPCAAPIAPSTGSGPAPERNLGRYGEDWMETSATLDKDLWRSSHFEAGLGARSVNLYHGEFSREPSVSRQIATLVRLGARRGPLPGKGAEPALW